ncbi:50S ribosomal protein L4 [Candidatus Uhrbacteria bacterium]|nr:50S ribosomal protein L4 [Candidatus Uhrbacteria bacterium]
MIKRKDTPPIPPITLDVYNQEGAVISKKELPGDIFNIPVKEELVHFAVTVQQSRTRAGTSATKTRGEVRGGGKKPWKQKGTGRARHGSIRSPLWKGGGVVFGPRTARNWVLRINKKVKKKALRMVLSDKARSGSLVILDALELPNAKTKDAVAALSRLPLTGTQGLKRGRVGVVIPRNAPALSRSMRNVPKTMLLSPSRLNVVDFLKCQKLVIPLKSLDEMIEILNIPKK